MLSIAARAILAIVAAAPLLISCKQNTVAENAMLSHAEDLIKREDRSRLPTKVEGASISKDHRSICGYVTIGDRSHIPYIIRHSKPYPKSVFATVDLVMLKPKYKGAPYESATTQAARILTECREQGHNLPVH